jgi:hypothetical protein
VNKKKTIALCGILTSIVFPFVLYVILIRPYGPQFRSSEFISDYFDCSLTLKDDSGKSFDGFGNETRVSITLYSLFLGEVEVLLPISNSSAVAGRNFTISSSIDETIRPFIKYAQNITFYGLQQGGGIAHVTVPSDLAESAMLGMRQLLVLNFSSVDMQHLLKFYLGTEDRSFTVTQRLFLCPELQFIGVPDSNPFFESFSTNQLGSEIRTSGESVYTDYRLRLSDSYRQQQYYGNALNTAIFTFVASIAISSATLFINTYKYFTNGSAFEGAGGTLTESSSKEEKKDKKAKQEEKTEDATETKETYDDIIIRLIRLVDTNFKFGHVDAFLRGDVALPFASFIVLLVLVEIYLFAAPIDQRVAVTTGFVALTIAFFTFMARFSEEHAIKINLKRLYLCVEADKKPLLKTLLKMKARNKEISLEQIYNTERSAFSKQKLIEKLYERS